MYYVYVLQSLRDSKLYIGYTSNNPEDRLKQHNSGQIPSTKKRKPFKLIYFEGYHNKFDALGREKFLKGGSGHKYLQKQLKHFLKGGKRWML